MHESVGFYEVGVDAGAWCFVFDEDQSSVLDFAYDDDAGCAGCEVVAVADVHGASCAVWVVRVSIFVHECWLSVM